MAEAGRYEARTIAWALPEAADDHPAPEARAAAVVEGTVLASYRFDRFKSRDPEDPPPPRLERLLLAAGDDASAIAEAAEVARVASEAANRARELQGLPSNVVTPSYLADRAREIADAHEAITAEVLGRAEIEQRGMGGLAAVARGSAEEPQLIALRYQGGAQGETLGLVGKAVTFDTGGISIKPAPKMEEMKMDMSGGAAVLEGVGAIAELGLPLNVVACVPATENMPSGTATKPGDIITQLNGKTVEVNNTDAEGRLILADALTYCVRELGADRVVDIATLTGAVLIALGSTYAALISNDDEWAQRVLRGRRAHRRAGLAPATPPRVQGADQGQGRRPHQRVGEAQGGDDLRGLVPGGVRRRQALGAPRHRGDRLGRRAPLRGLRPDRVRGAAAGGAGPRPPRRPPPNLGLDCHGPHDSGRRRA